MQKFKFRPWRLLVFGVALAFIILFFATRGLDHLDNEKGLFSFSDWLQGQVLSVSYEDRFCRHFAENDNSLYPPVNEVAKQLNIKDGDSVFVNGIHCGEWLVALRKTFPNIKLFGVDRNPESIAYISTFVKGNFTVALPFDLQTVNFGDKMQFDHAIIDGALSIYSPEYQCKTVRQMIPMLKAGGSLYIGKNFESCEENKDIEKDLQKYLHVQLLPKCYWSSHCLKGRTDIVEVLYSKENHMFPELHKERKSKIDKMKEKLLFDFSTCATSIFVYRHIVLLEANDNKLLPQSKHEKDKHKHECTTSQSVNSTQNKLFDKDVIRNAIKDIKLKGLDPV
jgi:hypothetical protein